MAARRKSAGAVEGGEATQRVLAAIDPDAGELIRAYLDEPLVAPESLSDQMRIYFKQIEAAADHGQEVDLELLTELAVRCERLLDEIDERMPEEHQRLIQAAVRYFIDADDSDGDVDSLIGLDDDVAVIEAVALAIDRGHVLED